MIDWDKRRNWLLLFVIQIVIFYIFSKINSVVTFFENLFEIQKNLHIQIFSFVSFSVGDIFYAVLGLYCIILGISFFQAKKRKKAQKSFLILLNVMYLVYQIFWGMLYFQPPISEKLPEKEITKERLKILTMKYLELSKKERAKVEEDKNGVFQIRNFPQMKSEIIQLQYKLPAYLISKEKVKTESIKPSFLAKTLHFSGVLGYYNPFTAEAQYNPTLPDTYLPFTISHETAHQMGYAREQEANFFGYLIGIQSENPDIKYSTYYFVLKSLLSALYTSEPDFVESVLEQYSPQMKRDRAREIQFQKENEGLIDEVLYFTNDIFLKSNQQEGSITYSYFIDLLVKYEEG